MFFIKFGALFLNTTIPLYVLFYQIQQYNTNNKQQNPLNSSPSFYSFLTNIFISSIVLISPILHILAMINPSYCYKGHCKPPHHYVQTQENDENKYMINDKQNKNFDNSGVKSDRIKSLSIKSQQMRVKYAVEGQIMKKQKQNSFNFQNSKEKINYKEAYNPNMRKEDKNQKQIFSFKINKIQNNQYNTPTKNKLSFRQDNIFDLNNNQGSNQLVNMSPLNNNVNQFTSIVPFLSGINRKSLSNLADKNMSPRSSRKSIKVVKHQEDNNISIEPFLLKNQNIAHNNKLNQQNFQIYKTRNKIRKPSIFKNKLPQNQAGNQYYQQQNNNKQKNFHQQEFQQTCMTIQCQFCQQCVIPRYLRMKHCYRCQKCVHKYDHHCVLLNICIGQFNQKYYIGFLYAHLYNTLLYLKQLLINIKQNVYLDPQTGIQYINSMYFLQAFSIIILLLNLVLIVYLVFIHTQFLLNNSTTYEKQRRDNINYFKFLEKKWAMNINKINGNKYIDDRLPDTYQQLKKYLPFDYGVYRNVMMLVMANQKSPIDWKLPRFQEKQKQKQNNKKQQKYMSSAKDKQTLGSDWYEWGADSISSGNVQAGQTTTKSRQSKCNQQQSNYAKFLAKN